MRKKGVISAKYRNEWKYSCTDAFLQGIYPKLKAALSTDKYADADGTYSVHSLYFDDVYDSCVRENDAGLSRRYKYRIRYYGDNKCFLRLERKEKLDGRCHKASAVLTIEQYNKILSGQLNSLLWETDDPVIRRFCVDSISRHITPKSIVDYERTAFVEPITNVRITFDRNISVSSETDRFLEGGYIKIPIQQKGMGVLEVKFDDILPSYIRHIITEKGLTQGTFSKYYFGRKELQSKGRL